MILTKFCINYKLESTGGSGGSTPDFQAAGGSGFDPQRRERLHVAGQITWGFLGDFERFVCTDSDSGRLSNPVKGKEYKLMHTYYLFQPKTFRTS